MAHVSGHDLKQLGTICSTICYHLTAHLAAVASHTPPSGPAEVAEIYQLASRLPEPSAQQWAALTGRGGGSAAAPAAAAANGVLPLAEGAERPAGKRLKWTPALEAELVRLVEDNDFRVDKLGKDALRGGSINWAGVARHFGLANGQTIKKKYEEVKGLAGSPKESGAGKKKTDGGEDGKPAKKAKKDSSPAAAAPAPAASPSKKHKAAAAAAAPTPASVAGGSGDWSHAQTKELQKLVESEEARKEALGKRKLRWKLISKHFDRTRKECRAHYTKATGKEAPAGEDE